jgi:hypothetical protein
MFDAPDTGNIGDQIRGFGFMHNGALDTIFRFLTGGPFRPLLTSGFPLIDPDSFGGLLVVRALGHYPTGEDLEFLARQFPLEGHSAANVEIAVSLARGGHYAVRPLFQAAIWRGPWNRSVLAAGVVHARTGLRLLGMWIERPPGKATSEDIRRVGFAVGQWGGLAGLDTLLRQLGNRTDHPALQGALLGALLAQTY